MSFAWWNTFPIVFDDGPTEISLAYDGLHEAAGVVALDPSRSALAPKDPDPLTLSSLADLEVKCTAIVLGSAATDIEHSMWEAFPDTMIDSLAAWEKMLGIADIAPTILERQRAVALAITRDLNATRSGLAQAIYAISPKLAFDPLSYDLTSLTLLGKGLGPLNGVSPAPATYRSGNAVSLFHNASGWPHFSDLFVLRIRYALADGETMPTHEVLRDVSASLLEVLPAWFSFEIYTLSDGDDGEGFYFDGGPNDDSFFDVTAFGET